MQNQPAGTIVLGTLREFVCAWCTNVSNKPKLRQHAYGEYRSHHQIERFWECRACGHQRPASLLTMFEKTEILQPTVCMPVARGQRRIIGASKTAD
jgi:hypothetical protein